MPESVAPRMARGGNAVKLAEARVMDAYLASQKRRHAITALMVNDFVAQWKRETVNDAAVLDLGCGRGEVLMRIKAPGRRCGVDTDKAAIADAQKADPDGIYRVNDVLDHALFPESAYEVVMLLDVLPLLPVSQAKVAVMNARRWLAKDGLLVICVPKAKYAPSGTEPYDMAKLEAVVGLGELHWAPEVPRPWLLGWWRG